MEVIFRFGDGPFSAIHSVKHSTREGIHILCQQPQLQRSVLFSRSLTDFGTTECWSIDGHIIKKLLLQEWQYGVNGTVFFQFLFTKRIITSFANISVFSCNTRSYKFCLFLADGLTTSWPGERENLLEVLLQRCLMFQKEVTK
jgi:hypothetical protein